MFQYSAGVAALPGHRIVRVQFRRPVPLDEGFRRIEKIISAASRPLTAFCACELRSPAPFTESGFAAFNKIYVGTLERWKIFDGKTNPVARSNVCPAIEPPPEPSFHAFCYTETAPGHGAVFRRRRQRRSAGGPRQLSRSYRAARRRHARPAFAKRRASCSARWSAAWRRSASRWQETTATQIYTVHDIHPFLADEIVRRGAARSGVTWHYNRPPVVDLEYEMDCRGVSIERIV